MVYSPYHDSWAAPEHGPVQAVQAHVAGAEARRPARLSAVQGPPLRHAVYHGAAAQPADGQMAEGRGVKSAPVPTRFRKFVGPPRETGCWPWTGSRSKMEGGYGRLNVGGRPVSAHRIAYQLYVGTIPSGMWVLHACDWPPCVNPEHLFLGTRATNSADAVAKGRIAHGEKHWNARLTERDVRAIRKLAPRTPSRALSRRFGVTQSTIWRVVNHQLWRQGGVAT